MPFFVSLLFKDLEMLQNKPIGVFDSGYGGLTILKELKVALPAYDFLYLGDNARAPYGSRSFDVVYEFTLEAVRYLFDQGCELVILACNTASAKALRSIQQRILPIEYPGKRVLGVIRPSAERMGEFTQTKHVGILATEGTVNSASYLLEIEKFFPEIQIQQWACPLWVPLIENGKHASHAGKEIIQEDIEALLAQDRELDCILLACTHYPILYAYLREIVPAHIQILSQGSIVANSLVSYLKNHPEMDAMISKNSSLKFLTTDAPESFDSHAELFLEMAIHSRHVKIQLNYE
jgi:glutamate racemase